MIARADGFLALPGGIGTLEEMAEVLTLRYLAQTDKPAVFFNQDGYYDDLLRFFPEHMTREGFRTARACVVDYGLYTVASRLEEIWPLLERPEPYEIAPIWREIRKAAEE